MINGKLPKRINNDLALFGDGSTKWIRLFDSLPYNLTDFSFAFLEFRNPASQDNTASFELRKDGNNFVQIRAGLAGSDNAYSYQIRFGGTNFSTLPNNAPDFVRNQNQNIGDFVSIISFSLDQTNNTFTTYMNGKKYEEITDPAITGVDFVGSLMSMLDRHGGVIPIDAAQNHGMFFDRVLTPDEHKLLARNWGVIPSSLHVNVLNHWPLTQKHYYKDGADVKSWDVVEQYNYAKVTAATPQHAILEGFTDAEVGADEPANQTQIFGTKSKQVSSNWGLKFNGTNQYAQQDPLTNNIVTTNRDNLTLVAILNKVKDTGSQDIPILFRNGAAVSLNINVSVSGNEIELSAELDSATGTASFTNSNWDRRLIIILEKTDENPANWVLWLNGIKVTPSSTVGTHGTTATEFTFTQLTLGAAYNGGGTFHADCIIEDVLLFDRLLTAEEKTGILKGVYPSANLLERANPEKRSDNQINTFAGNQLLLQNFTLTEFDSYYRESKSGIPEIKNCINMNGVTRSVNIPSLQSSSLELIVLCNTGIVDIDDLLTFGTLPTINKYYFNGVELANEAALIDAINTNSICQIGLEYDQLTTTITVNDFDGYLMQLSLNWIGKRDLYKNFNNSLFNPFVGSRSNYYVFNSENDGVDYINGNDATLNNITATEIVNINTLR